MALRQRAEDRPKTFLSFIFSIPSHERDRRTQQFSGLRGETGRRLKAKRKGRSRLPAPAHNRWERSGRRRGATEGKTIISGSGSNQSHSGREFDAGAGDRPQNDRRRAAQHLTFAQQRDEALMAGALGIVVEQVVQAGRQADQDRSQPENQHQAHGGPAARRIRVLTCVSRSQAGTIKQRMEAVATAGSFLDSKTSKSCGQSSAES